MTSIRRAGLAILLVGSSACSLSSGGLSGWTTASPSPRGDLVLVAWCSAAPNAPSRGALVDPLGNVVRALEGDILVDGDARWSPTGNMVLFERALGREGVGPPPTRLILHDVESGSEREVVAEPRKLLGFARDGLSVWWTDDALNLHQFSELDVITGERRDHPVPRGEFFEPQLLESGEIMLRRRDSKRGPVVAFWNPVTGVVEDWKAPAETEALEPIRDGRALLLIQRSGGNMLMRRLVVVDRATSAEQELLQAESFGWAAQRIRSRVSLSRAPDAPDWFEVSLEVGRMSKPIWLVDAEHERVVALEAVPADIRGGGYTASPAPSGEWILACAQHAAWQPEGVRMSCAVVRTSGSDATVRWRIDEPETSYVRWFGSDHLVIWNADGDTTRCVSIDLATGREHPLSPGADNAYRQGPSP